MARRYGGAQWSMMRAMRPLLLLDVDGVLMPTGSTVPPGYERLSSDSYEVVISPRHGAWPRDLASTFELVWATTWGESAGPIFGALLGLPEMPVVAIDRPAKQGTSKLPAVARFVEDRALAWVDDELFEDAFAWAAERPAATLLVRTSGSAGLSAANVRELRSFGEACSDGRTA